MTLGRFVLDQLRDCCFPGELRGEKEKASPYRLLYVLSGEGTLEIGEQRLAMKERTFALGGPKEDWRIRSEGQEPVRLLVASFRLAPEAKHAYPELADWSAEPAGRDDAGNLEACLLELLEEAGREDRYARESSEACLNRLTVFLCRYRQASGGRRSAQPPQPAKAVPEGGKADLVYETVRYIDRHLVQIRELGEIADALGYSYSRLSHVFRLEMGVSLQTYWNRKRIMRAMTLLQAGETTITRIAETLQYQSVHSFSKAFKKTAGLAPTEYKELYGRAGEDRQVVQS